MMQAQVLADQVRTLYRQTAVVVIANCVNTAIVSALAWGNGRRALLLGWMVLTLLVTGARLWLLWWYQREPRLTDAERWGARFVYGSAASGLLWGGASAALLDNAGSTLELVIIFFAGGMSAAAAGSLASYMPAFLAFAGPALLGLIAGVAAFGDPLHRVLAAVLALYGVGLFAVARVNHRALVEAFSLRFENTELLTALRRTQRQLEENNRTLERRVAERGEALRKQVEALRDTQRLEAVGRLAGGIAHDFNNLLTVLLANADELLESDTLDEKTTAGLREIHDAASRGAELVRQLLTFSRQQRTSPETLDLNITVSGMQKWLGRLLGESLTLEIALEEQPVFIRMDPTQLEQVIANLVTNARDAMAGGGIVSIETQTEELDDESERLPAGRYAVLSVTDAGVGMDEETRQRIFEPFFTTKDVGKGTGLGLATAHGIVEQAGGKISVSSEPGRGSRFRVYLPLVSAPEAAKPRAPTPSGMREVLRASAATILLVEDEPAIRAVAWRSLTKAGHHVLVADSAEAASNLSEEHAGPIQLLVTDVVMAGMDGPSLAAHLSPQRPEMRTLFISGYSGDHVLPAAGSGEDTAFLPKPFTQEALLAAVSALLSQPASAGSRRGSNAARASTRDPAR